MSRFSAIFSSQKEELWNLNFIPTGFKSWQYLPIFKWEWKLDKSLFKLRQGASQSKSLVGWMVGWYDVPWKKLWKTQISTSKLPMSMIFKLRLGASRTRSVGPWKKLWKTQTSTTKLLMSLIVCMPFWLMCLMINMTEFFLNKQSQTHGQGLQTIHR